MTPEKALHRSDAEKNRITRQVSQDFSVSLCVLFVFLRASAVKRFFPDELAFLRFSLRFPRLGGEKQLFSCGEPA